MGNLEQQSTRRIEDQGDATATQSERPQAELVADLLNQLERLSEDPVPSLNDRLNKLKAVLTGQERRAKRIVSDLSNLDSPELPEGYEPHRDRFGAKPQQIEMKLGLSSSAVQINLDYTPPKRGLLSWRAASLEASIIDHRGQKARLPAVQIGAVGQLNLCKSGSMFDVNSWEHDRILDTVEDYLFLVCEEALQRYSLDRTGHDLGDFDPEFETKLVYFTANATNLLSLPDFYREEADWKRADDLGESLTVEVGKKFDRIKQELDKLSLSIKELSEQIKDPVYIEQAGAAMRARITELHNRLLASEEATMLAELRAEEQKLRAQIDGYSAILGRFQRQEEITALKADLFELLSARAEGAQRRNLEMVQEISDIYLKPREGTHLDFESFKKVLGLVLDQAGYGEVASATKSKDFESEFKVADLRKIVRILVGLTPKQAEEIAQLIAETKGRTKLARILEVVKELAPQRRRS